MAEKEFEGFKTVRGLRTGDHRFIPPDLDPEGGEVTFFWPYPNNTMLTDEAVRLLVDRKVHVMSRNPLQQPVRGLIIEAVNQPENNGVMLTMKYGKSETVIADGPGTIQRLE